MQLRVFCRKVEEVNNGWDTLFWREAWLGDSPLQNLALGMFSLVDSYKRVKEYWIPNDGRNWRILSGLLPTYVEDQLAAVLVRPDDTERDGLCWVQVQQPPTNTE